MKKLMLILLFSCSEEKIVVQTKPSTNLEDLKSVVKTSMARAVSDEVQRRLIVSFGQSNDGVYTTKVLGGVVSGVYAFNVNTRVFENHLDPTSQFSTGNYSVSTLNGLGGFQVPLAKLLKVKYPNDSIYFVDYHIGGTAIAKWNARQGELFFALSYVLKLAFEQRNFDRVDFVFTQGEADCRNLKIASQYGIVEKELFSVIQEIYNPTTIIDYRLPASLSSICIYKDVVNQGKEANTGGNRILINSDTYEYNSDKVHMSVKNGIIQYANDIMKYY